jgi:hypothetical protein
VCIAYIKRLATIIALEGLACPGGFETAVMRLTSLLLMVVVIFQWDLLTNLADVLVVDVQLLVAISASERKDHV